MKITVGLPNDADTPMLAITPREREAIQVALATAEKTPITDAQDYPAEAVQTVAIPYGYEATIAFEEQAVGLCKHLAVRLTDKRELPSLDAVEMIAAEFGILPGRGVVAFWVDEEPAVTNILALANPPLS